MRKPMGKLEHRLFALALLLAGALTAAASLACDSAPGAALPCLSVRTLRREAKSTELKRAKMTTAKRSPPAHRHSASLCADLRVARRFSLLQVERAKDRDGSNACLSQLGQGRIRPSSGEDVAFSHRLVLLEVVGM